VIAQAFATMVLRSGGRVTLGVGTGEALNEIAVSGREWPEFKEWFVRLREAIRLMRELWTKDNVSFEGEY
jgi:coenzyme F420-dependent glucose-6-phosphate dehydrogenase